MENSTATGNNIDNTVAAEATTSTKSPSAKQNPSDPQVLDNPLTPTETRIEAFLQTIPFLSFQQHRILKEQALDLALWHLPGKEASIETLWPKEYDKSTKRAVKKTFSAFMAYMQELRKRPIDYSNFNPNNELNISSSTISENPTIALNPRNLTINTNFKSPDKIMGKCPCPRDGEQTRCCNLQTLDAVQQCAFACSYCSIQAFYAQNQVRVLSDLAQHLSTMPIPPDTWHIGTGQSSDSLLLGDDYGTLTALKTFAHSHPEIILELKTKSSRTDWIKPDIPPNIISTWSLNASTAALKEEHLAATPSARIAAARACSQAGHLVGFHIHPMVHFIGWQTEYTHLTKTLCDNIDPKNVVMVGIGTLTFTKANLKTLRLSGRPTRVTQMPLTPIAGKYSYDLDTKRTMFRHLYSTFPSDWKSSVFFYLCMEDPSLWLPCLGRAYPTNAAFESDMHTHYFSKVHSLLSPISTKPEVLVTSPPSL